MPRNNKRPWEVKLTLFRIGKVTQPWEIKRTDALQDLASHNDKEDEKMFKKFMDSWRNASQKLYDKYGSKLQGRYDKLAGMKLSPELNKILDALAELISPAIVAKMLTVVLKSRTIVDRYKATNAEEIIKKVLKDVKKVL